ncbi:hypothetical protein [Nitrospira moscoviensis]|uniref:Blue (type 1) copper domain-containing protein n=1 Tax=Nitrospira moscoviensis TaxID=42253 RepID=A0A0K2GH68_NITMO|nr:hypothetical protein [Nitrospira moscoviensis]ALA60308.1 conserved exported protein of unknown function [Nitrospira moscoviensis]
MMTRPLFLAFVLVSAVPGITAADAGAADLAAPPVAVFAALDDRFEGPDQLQAGLTTLRLHNRGEEPHQLQLLKLADDKSPADLAASLREQAQVPPWAKHMGGPNGVGAGETAEATVYLEPGTYVVICAIPTKDQRPHAALGMQKTVRVTHTAPSDAEFIGNVHMAMFDYEFVVVQKVDSGPHTFYVVNRGHQAHQVSLVQLNPGASTDDMLAAFGSPQRSPLPGKLMGGMAGLEPGGRGTFSASLSPGRYAMMCLFPNPAAHDSHAAKGMVMNFTVDK